MFHQEIELRPARSHGFEATKRVVETACVEEQVAERKLSARAAAIEQRRVAQRGECTDAIADRGKRDAERMPGIRVIRSNCAGIVMPTSYDARRALRGWLPGNHCPRGTRQCLGG